MVQILQPQTGGPGVSRRLFRYLEFLVVFLGSVVLTTQASAQANDQEGAAPSPWTGTAGIHESTRDLMTRAASQPSHPHPVRRKFTLNFQDVLPNPDAPNVATWPPEGAAAAPLVASPQTGSINFTAATLADSAFPPDTMGVAGPTQFIIAINNRIRSFDKSTGIADGVLNVDTDIFFQSVMTPPISNNFTSDPRIRYDRLSGRWLITIIDVPGLAGDQPNRVLLAVSDTSVITPATIWTYFFFRHDTVTPTGDSNNFADYPTLGIDANALYIGVNIFSARGRGSFSSTTGFVVRKSSILGSGPIVVTAFRGLVSKMQGILQGLYTPQGVDNYDPAATEGYFIGVDPSFGGRLHLLRIINPGGSPSTPGRVQINVPATGGTLSVPHLGNTGGTAGNLDGLDRRLIAAHVRNGRLWTTANIAVDNTGVPSSATRDGVRWYELQGIASGQTPSVVQSGTVFQPSASNDTAQRHYWMGSVMVSGQGHAAMGFSVAGANERINAGTVGRLVGDPLGTMRTPVLYTASTTAYNPARDPGSAEGRRWGDYSYTSLDPSDDMTMWTIQQFCNATDSYGVQVLKLLGPPPATPITCTPASLGAGTNNVLVTVTGSSTNGEGFFDPGAGFSNHLAVAINGAGATISDIHFIDPTHLTMTVSLSANATSGARTITVTNPDGQTATSASGIFTVTGGNTPPNISNLSDQTIPEDSSTSPLSFTVGDSETPASALVVTASSSNTNLVTASSISFGGNAVNRTVVITPATNQFGSSIIAIIVTDASGGTASNSFQLNVTPVNDAPLLVSPGIHTVNEGQTLLVTNSASDVDGPALSFSLAGAPAGATINAATGVFSWNPTEADGPGTNLIKIIVRDGGSPSLSATQTLTVVVNEINVAPFLQPIADRIIYQDTTLIITNVATDPDSPANQIHYSLSNAPIGAVIQPLTGVFTWTPTAGQADTTNQITVIATDDGTPALSASDTFQVVVSLPPYIQSITADASNITITWSAVPGTTYQLQYKTSLEETTWTDLPGTIVATGNTASRGLPITDSQRFYRVAVLSQ